MSIKLEEEEFLTVPETAELLSVSSQTIRNYIKRGRLKERRIGKSLFIRKKDLLSLLLL
jgi:excisionase family DNA binding protein